MSVCAPACNQGRPQWALSNTPGAFISIDLEIMDRVYEAAWAELEARDPFRDREKDGERGDAS